MRLDEQAVVQYSRLSEEAVLSLLSTSGYAEPLYVQNADNIVKCLTDYTSSAATDVLTGYSESSFSQLVLRKICATNGISEREMCRFRLQDQSSSSSASASASAGGGRPTSIYPGTALQIGLLPNVNVPDLIKALLPSSHYSHSARFLRKWISMPPPPHMADHMRALCQVLHDSVTISLPSASRPFHVGKAIQLLHAGQCNASVFREIAACAVNVSRVLSDATNTPDHRLLTTSLLELTSFQSGVPATLDTLLGSARAIVTDVNSVVADAGCEDLASGTAGTDGSLSQSWSDLLQLLPHSKDQEVLRAFFAHNEAPFRGHVLTSHAELAPLYAQIDAAAQALVCVLLEEFPCVPGPNGSLRRSVGLDFVYHDNILCSKVKPSVASGRLRDVDASKSASPDKNGDRSVGESNVDSDEAASGKQYFHPVDRRGQTLAKRYTTRSVNAALAEYLRLTGEAPMRVEGILKKLCAKWVEERQVGIVHISNWALILQTAHAHAIAARRQGWCLPVLTSFPDPSGITEGTSGSKSAESGDTLELRGLTAWWMDRAHPQSVANDLNLRGLFLLTAPNMSGKSTLMRSVLVAALLANCGLFVPCSSARVPRYKSFFLRATSYDIPSEGKSAFAIEMDDMHVVLRDSSSRSLVMVDEIGRGTSSRDGAALAGALLEALGTAGVHGIFATHLHEVLRLPLHVPGMQLKRMSAALGASADSSSSGVKGPSAESSSSSSRINSGGGVGGTRKPIRWTYLLEDGLCTNSLALETARAYGLPERVLSRAEELTAAFDLQAHSPQVSQRSDHSTNDIVDYVNVDSVGKEKSSKRLVKSKSGKKSKEKEKVNEKEKEKVIGVKVKARAIPSASDVFYESYANEVDSSVARASSYTEGVAAGASEYMRSGADAFSASSTHTYDSWLDGLTAANANANASASASAAVTGSAFVAQTQAAAGMQVEAESPSYIPTPPLHNVEAAVPFMWRLSGYDEHEHPRLGQSLIDQPLLAQLHPRVGIVEATHEPAASFEGQSCVYVLQVTERCPHPHPHPHLHMQRGSTGTGASNSASASTLPECFYVGESDSVTDRLRRHRAETFKGASVRMAVIRADNKGHARRLETHLIGALKQSGFCVVFDTDGQHKQFGQQSRHLA